ncbi:DUF262 domain-containing protein [Campylobacter jejuni]|uniref:DUF262 domain-containing protein n=1 Tax=Campylobacter jejuni TaxID=197 RepID=UPI000F806C93|nr:DUF262 domain-containing protein [Campylobacter jejuni]RTJ90161.1 DUF262 domain-containing protein [Campylobacter jejuni]HEC1717788.1 DUF262 domain-containing protein [Campylobacter jejuni]
MAKIEDIFNNKIFSIPNYQRDYAWTNKNLEDLWDDLLEAEGAVNDQMSHFLGTLVVSPNKDNKSIYDIIDGQQRATTLFMLRYALNYKTVRPDRDLNKYLDDNDNYRLRVIDNNKKFFSKILKQIEKGIIDMSLENEIESRGHKNLFDVWKAIWSKVNTLDSDRAKKLLNILDSMSLMWLEESDSGRAIRMFQTVNDRGVSLTILDKLKALLILYSNKYCAGELDDIINNRFGNIFKISSEIKKHRAVHSLGDNNFKKEIEARIFNYHALSIKDIGYYKNGADTHYESLKLFLKKKNKDETFKDWLDGYSSDLVNFFENFLNILKLTEVNTEAFNTFCVLKINPLFYPSLLRLKINNILDDECLKLFSQAHICFYTLNNSNDFLAFKLIEVAGSKKEFKNRIIDNCKKCVQKDYNCFEDFLDDIADDNYIWGAYHYLFLEKQNIDIKSLWKLIDEKVYSFTKEHIIPKNINNNGSLKQYGFKDEDDFDKYINTFGNLVPLEKSLNSSNSDKSLIDKRANFLESKLFYNVNFANSEDYLSFNKDYIIKRNENFKEWGKIFFKDFL